MKRQTNRDVLLPNASSARDDCEEENEAISKRSLRFVGATHPADVFLHIFGANCLVRTVSRVKIPEAETKEERKKEIFNLFISGRVDE